MTDDKTIGVYNDRAQDYADLTETDTPMESLVRFMEALPEGGKILDLGCGPATSSAHMRAAGFAPDPVDASPEMVALANKTYDIGARLGTFDDVQGEDVYDGIWANFSLLHAQRADLPRHLAAIKKALKSGGIFHIGMKTGSYEGRDTIGRYYTYVTEEELLGLLDDAGFRHRSSHFGEEPGLSGEIAPFIIVTAYG